VARGLITRRHGDWPETALNTSSQVLRRPR